ncbi:MAG: hypothetical protein RLZZ602_1440, partial [Pseudomonadota bacterium]
EAVADDDGGFADGFIGGGAGVGLGLADLDIALLLRDEDFVEGSLNEEGRFDAHFAGVEFDAEAEFRCVDEVVEAVNDRFAEGGSPEVEGVIGTELGGGVEGGVIQQVLEEVGGVLEAEGEADGVRDAVVHRDADVDDVAIAGEGVAIDTCGEEGGGHGGVFTSGEFFFRGHGVESGGGGDGFGFTHGDIDHFVDGVGEFPVEAGLEELVFSDPDGAAEAEQDSDLVRGDGEQA